VLPVRDLIVVGAGAKATAIAAKAHAINRLGVGRISLLIVEQRENAASWLGANGMTSGEELLAITPLKDVGFPYRSFRSFGEHGKAIDAVLTEFSWPRYLIEQDRYAQWLNAGLSPVQHREFGSYLGWALARATDGPELQAGHVKRVSLDREQGEWIVEIEAATGALQRRCRALVLTGPGRHRHLAHDADAAARLFHCDDRRSEFDRLPADQACDVAIVGAGDGALSAAIFLRRLRPKSRLTLYTPSPPLSRGESFLENRVFSDPDCVGWESLAVEVRRDFVRHTDRGVFGPEQLAQVVGDVYCKFVVGRVARIRAAQGGVCVEHASPGGRANCLHDYVVNCTGFDLLGQVRELFSPRVRAEIEAQAGPVWTAPSRRELKFGRMLELVGLRPPLHIPGLAALSQGPGFANLGCLGLLSDRILQASLATEQEELRAVA
jgi:mycobactin lysine-N-oxygenase